MKIKIISDSTCDLPEEILRKYDITLLPLTVIKDGEAFLDGVTITPAEIFAHVAAGGSLCTTSAINIGDYQKLFAEYADKYDGIIHINIGSGFSSCYQNACLAAEDFPNVRVVDSENLSTGQGQVVLQACRLAETATDLDELKAQLDEYKTRVEVSFLLDRLEYMVKGGRCSSATALGANLLHLKPCIEVKDGKMTVVKKYRGSYTKCLASYAKDRLANRKDLGGGTLFTTWTVVDDEALNAVRDCIAQYGHFDEIIENLAGSTISCHCGPGTLGLVFVRK